MDAADLLSHIDLRNISLFGGQTDVVNNAQVAQQQLAQEQALLQQQQQKATQLGGGGGGLQMPLGLQTNPDDASSMLQQSNLAANINPQQLLQQLQQAQLKFQQKQLVLNKLKNDLTQLLGQQKQLQMQQVQGQQTGQNMSHQLPLLQQIQQRTQLTRHQHNQEYQELMAQHKAIQQMQSKMQLLQQQQQQQQQQNNNMQNAQQQPPNQQPPNLGSSQQSQNSNGSQPSNNVQQQLQQQQKQQQQEMLAKQAQQALLQQQQEREQQKRESDMQELTQIGNQSLNDNTKDTLIPSMDDPLQNVGNLDALDDTNLDDSAEILDLPEPVDQPLVDPSKKDSDNSGNKASAIHPLIKPSEEVAGDESNTNKSNAVSLDDSTQSVRSTVSKSKKQKTSSSALSSVPQPPAVSAGALERLPRGRGGKGKRLREIEKINNLEGEANGHLNLSGNKRSMDDMNKNGPSPDTNVSGGAGGGKKDGASQPSLSKGDVEQHLLMLNKGLHLTSRTITHKCLPIVQRLIDDPYGWVFRDAVDPVLFSLPDYFEVVKNPMHLLLVKKKLENAVYTDMASFERDVKLVFENAILYNGEESDVGTLAKTMKGVFEAEYKKVCEGM